MCLGNRKFVLHDFNCNFDELGSPIFSMYSENYNFGLHDLNCSFDELNSPIFSMILSVIEIRFN